MTERYIDRLEATIAWNNLDQLQTMAEQSSVRMRVGRMAANALILANRGPRPVWHPRHIRAGKALIEDILCGNPRLAADPGIMPRVDA